MKGRTTVPVNEEVPEFLKTLISEHFEVACVQTSPISFVAVGKDRF